MVGRIARWLRDEEAAAFPLRARQGGQDRYSTGTCGHPTIAAELRRVNRRGMTSQFPKLIVRVGRRG